MLPIRSLTFRKFPKRGNTIRTNLPRDLADPRLICIQPGRYPRAGGARGGGVVQFRARGPIAGPVPRSAPPPPLICPRNRAGKKVITFFVGCLRLKTAGGVVIASDSGAAPGGCYRTSDPGVLSPRPPPGKGKTIPGGR